MTPLERALQGFEVDGLELDGRSHSAWRERIGNAVPPPAAAAIATPVWVREPEGAEAEADP